MEQFCLLALSKALVSYTTENMKHEDKTKHIMMTLDVVCLKYFLTVLLQLEGKVDIFKSNHLQVSFEYWSKTLLEHFHSI